MDIYAHSRPAGEQGSWQLLESHLHQVAKLARTFAPENLRTLAEIAGLWHDAGKYQRAFQRYIGADAEASNEDNPAVRSVPHSAAGAALAFERFGPDHLGRVLALVIAAHHGSLSAVREIADVVRHRGAPLLQASREGGLPPGLEAQQAELPPGISALGIRILFSALVDADLLDTEAWSKGTPRESAGEQLAVLRDRISAACEKRNAHAQRAAGSAREAALAAMRDKVYRDCVARAADTPGAFTLTVPTGGGKTLSGMAFALHHAAAKGMQRVIVVAPYTSILEQTATVYRDVLGVHNVVEHHSNLDPLQDTDRNRQACENWDAPVIVTTSVQFFESLYAAHKKDCRKLHRIANSVVLLDEVQTFPEGMLQPIHAALQQLVEHFHVTVVHGTATQPLLAQSSTLPPKLRVSTREIVTDPAQNYEAVRGRFELKRLGDPDQPIVPQELAGQVANHARALVIVHRRADARQLAEHLGERCFHLSAAMCAEHRSIVLAEVRQKLFRGEPCLLVATQLVEAGVDIDFPVVFRALAGLATLAQAAGRCNREMRLPHPGQFFVFRPGELKDGRVVPSLPPRGSLRLAEQIARAHYFDGEEDPDLNDPSLFPRFTRSVLQLMELDRANVMEAEREWDFPLAAERFRMIEDSGIAVVAPYGDAMRVVEQIRSNGPSRELFRSLQRYTVNLHASSVERMYADGVIELVLRDVAGEVPKSVHEVLWVVREAIADVYDARFGFIAEPGELKPIIL